MAGSKRPGSEGGGSSRGLVLLLLANLGLVLGLLFDYMPMIVDNQIKRNLELATNEEIQTIWSRPPVDINSYYWLYHLENADQFLDRGDKVRLRRVGPFHFTSRMDKRILELSQNRFRLFYNATRHIRLNESQSTEGLDEPLQLLNPIYAGLAGATRKMTHSMESQQQQQMMISSAQRLAEKFNETLVMRLTPRQALVGREVKLMGAAKKLADTFGLEQQLPDALPGNLFGYVAVQNGTWSGPFEIYTGYQASMSSLGDIISYKGKRRLTEYQGRCNRLQTSAGELRPMPIGDQQVLEMFRPELCRIVRLKPTAGVRRLKEGLTIGYTLANEDFASAQENPDNRCFCQNNSLDDYCSLSGVIELAPCSYWTPIAVTASNMKLDPKILDSIQDWDPELFSSRLETVADSEPTQVGQLQILKRFGLPLKVDLTIIIFIKVARDERYRQLRNVPEVSYVPLVMTREQAVIPPNLAQIIVNLERFLALTRHLKVVMYLSAVVLLCWLCGHYYSLATRDRVRPATDFSLNFNHSSSMRFNGAVANLVSPRSSLRSQAGDSVGADQQSLGTSIGVGIGQPIGSRQKRAPDEEQQQQQPKAASKGHPPAVFFSKVDEMRGGGSRNMGADAAQLDSAPTAEGAELTTQLKEPKEQDKRKVLGKNWFVKVYSSFVRMLDDIRSSINDSDQLDRSENDYQDKQLEMLAGRIDTWQRQNEAEAEAEASQQPLAGDEAADTQQVSSSPKPDDADAPKQQAAALASEGPPVETPGETSAQGGADEREQPVATRPAAPRLMVNHSTSTDDSQLVALDPSRLLPTDELSSSAGNKLAANGVLGDNDAHDLAEEKEEEEEEDLGQPPSSGAGDGQDQDQHQHQEAAAAAAAEEAAELDSRKGINDGDKEPAILLSAPSAEPTPLGNDAEPKRQVANGESAPAQPNNISGVPVAPDESAPANKRQRQARQIKGATTVDTITTSATTTLRANGGNHISHHGKIILQRQANGAGSVAADADGP